MWSRLEVDSDPNAVGSVEGIRRTIAVIQREVRLATVLASLERHLYRCTESVSGPGGPTVDGVGNVPLVKERVTKHQVLLEAILKANSDLVLGKCIRDECTSRGEALIATEVDVVADTQGQYGRQFKVSRRT